MTKRSSCKCLLYVACGLGLLVTAGNSASGQDAVLAELYGSGVHQYFSGNASQAIADLTAAIDGGSKDPRVYYFRALAEMKMGWSGNVEADLKRGALLESADINQFYPVGKSLERVQGSSRMAIERHRTLARAQAFQRQRNIDAVRYEERRKAESEVLRAPAAAPVKPPTARPPAPVPPAAPDTPPPDDPFATEDKPEAEPAEDMPAEDMPAEEPPAEEMPAEETPAEEAPPEPAPPDDPPAAAPDEDPFGDPPAKEEPKAESAEPASADKDPFADDK